MPIKSGDAQIALNIVAALYKLLKRITGGKIGGVTLPSQRPGIGDAPVEIALPHRPGGFSK